ENLKEDLGELKRQIEWMEKEKKNNVVVEGRYPVSKDSNDLREELQNLIESKLEVDVQVEAIRKISDRVCVLKLNTEDGKKKVMHSISRRHSTKSHTRVYLKS
ncbi:hypothetical protein HHI36_013353, partial [Cryptolaemus montrouzieri]